MSTVPNAVVNNQPGELTPGEAQRLVSDAWTAMNIRLTPGKLHTKCYARIQTHVRQKFDVLPELKDVVFTNYPEAVRILADAYFRAAKELMFTEGALEWIVPHPVIEKRRTLELQNRGLAPVEPTDVPDRAKLEQEFADKVKAQKAHEQAVRDIEVAISGILFHNIRGIDQAETDRVRADLRKFAKHNLGKANGVQILGIVRQSIAGAYQAYERRKELWNSR